MAQIDRDGGEEGVELGLAPFGLDQFELCGRMKAFRQTFHLICIEDRIGFQHPAGLVSLFAGVERFNLLGVALVEDRDGRFFAFADLPAELLALAVGHPVGGGKSGCIGHKPQPKDIHTPVWRPASAERARDRVPAPWLDPRLRACFQTGDDFLGDAGGGRQAAALPLAIGHDGSPD